jgi:hypothetical protein
MLSTDKTVTISGKLVALEIIKQNSKYITMKDPLLLVYAVIYVLIPIIRASVLDEPIFKN